MCAGVGSGCNFRKVPAGSGECGLLPGNLDRSRFMIVFEHLLVMTLSAWEGQIWHKAIAVGDITKFYFLNIYIIYI